MRHITTALRVLRPPLVFVENVAALRRRGLDVVHADLAALGYDTSWLCLRASDIGAPHRREPAVPARHHQRRGRACGHCPHPAPVTAKDPDTSTDCPTSSNPTALATTCCRPHAPATPAPLAAAQVPASGRRCHRCSFPLLGRRTGRKAVRDNGAPAATATCRPQPCDAQRLPYPRPGPPTREAPATTATAAPT
ncbi:DNA cytosine methyltransferase [Micromonospora chersina]|uniref:DNA cytosine methyltransferase n=1 Tax=Micromonospora chersina TaxID=47854 RepID=UPI0033FCE5D3